MKFTSFKEFRTRIGDINDIVEFLKVDLTTTLRDLAVGLNKLTFVDNFDSFKTTVTIPATKEVQIRNEIRNATTGENVIPTQRIIVRSNVAEIVDGDTEWSREQLYLKNTNATTDATVTVVFLR